MSRFDLATFLKTALPDLVPSGVGRLAFPLVRGASASVAVQLVPHWACFNFALPSRIDQPPMTTMLRQSGWPGNVKLVARSAGLALCAEVPLIVETAADRSWVVRQVGNVVQGLRCAAANRLPETPADAGGDCDTTPELLADRVRAAGWHAAIKADGEIQVDIEPRSVRRVVSIVRQTTGLHARVHLGTGELAAASKDSVRAATHFLLRASSSLRFARAWISGAAASPSDAGFECTIAAGAGDGPLVTAIDAMTTACDLFGCEAEALIQSTALARQYLQSAQGVPRGVQEPIPRLRAPATDPVLPLAAGPAFPVYPTPTLEEGVTT